METVSRRMFFNQAGAVAAVATVASSVAVGPMGLASAVAGAASIKESDLTPQENLRKGEDLVAHVKNARTGEISLFIGTKEVTIHDRKVGGRVTGVDYDVSMP
jgi:hypothetical protein